MIWSDFFKGGLVGFLIGICTCMAIFLICVSMSSPFFVVKSQPPQLDPVEVRLNLLEYQVGRINERLSDVNITAMRDLLILQREDMAGLAKEFYEFKNK